LKFEHRGKGEKFFKGGVKTFLPPIIRGVSGEY